MTAPERVGKQEAIGVLGNLEILEILEILEFLEILGRLGILEILEGLGVCALLGESLPHRKSPSRNTSRVRCA